MNPSFSLVLEYPPIANIPVEVDTAPLKAAKTRTECENMTFYC